MATTLSLYELNNQVQLAITNLQTQINNKQDKFTEDSTHRWFTDIERNKLVTIQTGAEVNQNTYTAFKIGTSIITSTLKNDVFEFSAGSNITLTPDASNKRMVISAITATYAHPSTHPATMIVEDPTHRFVTDTDKSNWNLKANNEHTHIGSEITSPVATANSVDWSGIQNKPTTLNGYGITDAARFPHNHNRASIIDFAHTHIGADITTPVSASLNTNAISGHTWDEIVLLSNTTPIGSIASWPIKALPDGWMECNGQAISRQSFSALFAKIGTMYGAGDNVTTFNLPDLRGYFVRGWDNNRGLDSGRELGTYQTDDFKSHTHTINEGDDTPQTGGQLNSGDDYTNLAPFTQTTSATGGLETRPKNISLIYMIKAKHVLGSDPTVQGANADTLDGYHANDFILKGSPDALHGREIFTTNGFFTVREGTTRVFVSVVGAGGGGGAGSSTCRCAGKGGKAGQTLMKVVSVAAGQRIPITVGASGLPGIGAPVAPGANGYDGGSSSFGIYAAAMGGKGGLGGTPADGIAETTDEITPQPGSDCPPYGIGGAKPSTGVGLDAQGFGAGGSGGWANNGNTGYKGGYGAPGIVIVEW